MTPRQVALWIHLQQFLCMATLAQQKPQQLQGACALGRGCSLARLTKFPWLCCLEGPCSSRYACLGCLGTPSSHLHRCLSKALQLEVALPRLCVTKRLDSAAAWLYSFGRILGCLAAQSVPGLQHSACCLTF